MSAETLTYTGKLVVNTCWCGIRHAVPEELERHRLRQHHNGRQVDSIYCPLGHAYVPAGKPETERLQESLQRERDRSARLAAEAEQAKASARAHKGAATKARKRAKAGVCPCCNRTFKQLARHMESQHPDFDPAAAPSTSGGTN